MLKFGNSFKERKLIADFLPRTNYIVHINILKTYLELGLKLEKIVRGVSFEHSAYLKNHVFKLANMRSNAKSVFDKDLFKLLSNSIYGKFIQNPSLYNISKLFYYYPCKNSKDFREILVKI